MTRRGATWTTERREKPTLPYGNKVPNSDDEESDDESVVDNPGAYAMRMGPSRDDSAHNLPTWDPTEQEQPPPLPPPPPPPVSPLDNVAQEETSLNCDHIDSSNDGCSVITASVVSTTSVLANQNQIKGDRPRATGRSRFVSRAILVVLSSVVIVVGVVVAFKILSPGNRATSGLDGIPLDKSTECPPKFATRIWKDPFTQCVCYGKIVALQTKTRSAMDSLNERFGFSNLTIPKDSCDTANVALAWLASTSTPEILGDDQRLFRRYTLAYFFQTLNGTQWFRSWGWFQDDEECGWYGIECDSSGSFLKAIDMGRNNLKGTIPLELASLLTDLQFLNLRINDNLGGSLDWLSKLTNLERLVLTDNKFRGSLPSLEHFSHLRHFTLVDPSKTISLASWPILTSLTHLRLEVSIQSQLPTTLGLLTNLEQLSFSFSSLNGTIPSEIGKLSNLKFIDLAYNKLTGTLPSDIKRLINLSLLTLQVNNLSGALPSELGMLVSLTELQLGNNIFVGPIPSEIGMLSRLLQLNVGHNEGINGSLPSEVVNLPQLRTLTLAVTSITGTVPTSFCEGFQFEMSCQMENSPECPQDREGCNSDSGVGREHGGIPTLPQRTRREGGS